MSYLCRRAVLAGTVAAGLGTLSGCLGGVDNDAEFSTDADLSIGASELNDIEVAEDRWLELTGGDANPNFDQTFVTGDESVVLYYRFDIQGDVEEAESRFADARSDAGDESETVDISDAGFVVEDSDVAGAVWRYSNAIGQAWSGHQSGLDMVPDQERAIGYAKGIVDLWAE